MAPRHPKTQTIAELIADAVKAHFAGAGRGAGATAGRSRPAARTEPVATGRGRVRRRVASPAPSAQADSASAAPASPVVAEPSPVAAPAPSSLAAQRAAEKELLDRVRTDLQAAYEGVPVSPERIAFRLKVDRDLVDAALTYLVRRKEARSKWVKGRPAYLPAFPH